MKLKFMIFVGFFISFLSFVLGALGNDRTFCTYGFMLGFYMLATGIVLRIIQINYEAQPEFKGIKLGAIGFLVISLNFLVEYAGINASIGVVLTWIGSILMLSGVIYFMKKKVP